MCSLWSNDGKWYSLAKLKKILFTWAAPHNSALTTSCVTLITFFTCLHNVRRKRRVDFSDFSCGTIVSQIAIQRLPGSLLPSSELLRPPFRFPSSTMTKQHGISPFCKWLNLTRSEVLLSPAREATHYRTERLKEAKLCIHECDSATILVAVSLQLSVLVLSRCTFPILQLFLDSNLQKYGPKAHLHPT